MDLQLIKLIIDQVFPPKTKLIINGKKFQQNQNSGSLTVKKEHVGLSPKILDTVSPFFGNGDPTALFPIGNGNCY